MCWLVWCLLAPLHRAGPPRAWMPTRHSRQTKKTSQTTSGEQHAAVRGDCLYLHAKR